jgi:hypothetical protein
MKKCILIIFITLSLFSCHKEVKEETTLINIVEQQLKKSIADTTGFEIVKLYYPHKIKQVKVNNKSDAFFSGLYKKDDYSDYTKMNIENRMKDYDWCYSYSFAKIKARNDFGGLMFDDIVIFFDSSYHINMVVDRDKVKSWHYYN